MLSASKSGSGLATGYNLTRSLRFRRSATGHLSRTPATTTNRRTWTWSGWAKRGELGTNQSIFNDTGPLGNNDDSFGFNFSVNNEFVVGTGSFILLTTTSVFRDPSAYYHIVVVLDTTQATANDRIKVYINNVQVTSFSTNTIAANIPQNFQAGVNTANLHNIGNLATVGGRNFDGYLAEVNFIDGQALTPSSFGSTNALTGVWQPARYGGTYGNNGFYLPFTDNSALTTSSNVGLGKDFSGNGNYWTTNNISITAGVTYDSMTDVPTLTSATAANFCVMNPLAVGATTSTTNGNLNVVNTATLYWDTVLATMGFSSGKYYWEMTTDATYPGTVFCGIAGIDIPYGTNNLQDANSTLNTYGSLFFCDTGESKLDGNTRTAYSTALTAGQVLGVAVDRDAKTCVFYKNGVSLGSISFSSSAMAAKTIVPIVISYYSGSVYVFNFGQRPFTYTAPTGFVALNTYNLPTSTIVKGNTVMDATLYTGNGGIQSVTNAASFKPDLVWNKVRSTANSHILEDSVRGATKGLSSDSTSAEVTNVDFLQSFNSGGFTVGPNALVNQSSATYVAWQWQAGQGTTSSNTNGTITSTVSVNASAGFSVVTYTVPATNTFTVGHGLGVAPSLIFVKGRNAAYNWDVYHGSLGATGRLVLNTTAAFATTSGPWANTAPTSTVFSSSGNGVYYNSGDTLVAYCWTPIAGFSAFGSYTGNGSGDGPFVYTGFRPKFVMIKSSSNTTDWIVEDSSRNTYNVSNSKLSPNTSNAEYTSTNDVGIDFLSNGFKLKGVDGAVNASAVTYIYMAYAENPLKNALAR